MQNEFIKFRVRPDEKQRLATFARNCDTSVSALLRRAAMATMTRRTLGRDARLDLAAMRRAANALQAAIDDVGTEASEAATRMRHAAIELHRIAVRQLDLRR